MKKVEKTKKLGRKQLMAKIVHYLKQAKALEAKAEKWLKGVNPKNFGRDQWHKNKNHKQDEKSWLKHCDRMGEFKLEAAQRARDLAGKYQVQLNVLSETG